MSLGGGKQLLLKRDHADILLEEPSPLTAAPFLVDMAALLSQAHPINPHSLLVKESDVYSCLKFMFKLLL